jgi:hypothetical protein
LVGTFAPYVQQQIAAGVIAREDVHLAALECKTSMKSFIIFQLANKLIEMGIGCGYYDENGNDDNGGIHIAMNNYIFDTCFQNRDQNDGYRYFIEFMMAQFRRSFSIARHNQIHFSLDEVATTLDLERLAKYWSAHKENILARKFETTKDEIVGAGSRISFLEGVPQIFEKMASLPGG